MRLVSAGSSLLMVLVACGGPQKPAESADTSSLESNSSSSAKDAPAAPETASAPAPSTTGSTGSAEAPSAAAAAAASRSRSCPGRHRVRGRQALCAEACPRDWPDAKGRPHSAESRRANRMLVAERREAGRRVLDDPGTVGGRLQGRPVRAQTGDQKEAGRNLFSRVNEAGKKTFRRRSNRAGASRLSRPPRKRTPSEK